MFLCAKESDRSSNDSEEECIGALFLSSAHDLTAVTRPSVPGPIEGRVDKILSQQEQNTCCLPGTLLLLRLVLAFRLLSNCSKFIPGNQLSNQLYYPHLLLNRRFFAISSTVQHQQRLCCCVGFIDLCQTCDRQPVSWSARF